MEYRSLPRCDGRSEAKTQGVSVYLGRVAWARLRTRPLGRASAARRHSRCFQALLRERAHRINACSVRRDPQTDGSRDEEFGWKRQRKGSGASRSTTSSAAAGWPSSISPAARLGRRVALKELSPFHASDPSWARRFLSESRIAGSLGHPNIVTVHDYFEHEGIPYIAMEYMERGSLRPWVGHLSFVQVGGVLEGLLAGLAHAHGQGIVHRDLKPENLMITADGSIKIADFGIAKALFSPQTVMTLTQSGMTVGTPTYMAPEQAMAKTIAPQTDLYSTGVIAYELLTGSPPFTNTDTPWAVLHAHIYDPPPPIRSRNLDIDPKLAEWVEGLLAKEQADRPANALEAWHSLEDILVTTVGPLWRRGARLPADGMPTPAEVAAPASTDGESKIPTAAAATAPVAEPEPEAVPSPRPRSPPPRSPSRRRPRRRRPTSGRTPCAAREADGAGSCWARSPWWRSRAEASRSRYSCSEAPIPRRRRRSRRRPPLRRRPFLFRAPLRSRSRCVPPAKTCRRRSPSRMHPSGSGLWGLQTATCPTAAPSCSCASEASARASESPS